MRWKEIVRLALEERLRMTNSREKGKRGERELAAKLREHGYDCRRGVQYQGGPDSPDVIGLPHIHIECKRTEHLHLYDSLDQSRRDARGSGDIPAVFYRKNDCDWVVIMYLEDFMPVYKGEIGD